MRVSFSINVQDYVEFPSETLNHTVHTLPLSNTAKETVLSISSESPGYLISHFQSFLEDKSWKAT